MRRREREGEAKVEIERREDSKRVREDSGEKGEEGVRARE